MNCEVRQYLRFSVPCKLNYFLNLATWQTEHLTILVRKGFCSKILRTLILLGQRIWLLLSPSILSPSDITGRTFDEGTLTKVIQKRLAFSETLRENQILN